MGPSLSQPAADLTTHALDNRHRLLSCALPSAHLPDTEGFEALWSMHPSEFRDFVIHGRRVKMPRWQVAYGADYHYTGQVHKALPVPDILRPYLDWCQQCVDPRVNGLVVNWYDAALAHYIGKHRDSVRHMFEGAPIVMVSLGAERLFRLRPWPRGSGIDFPARHGSVFILPYETNLTWTHEVLHRRRDQGRRISITLRAFNVVNLPVPGVPSGGAISHSEASRSEATSSST